MTAKADFSKLLKDLQKSAREFAQYGLEYSSKALDRTADTLSSLGDELKQRAQRFASKYTEDQTEPPADSQQ